MYMLAMLCDPNWGFRYLRWYLDATISSSDGRAAVVKAMRGMYTYCREGALPKLRASLVHRTGATLSDLTLTFMKCPRQSQKACVLRTA